MTAPDRSGGIGIHPDTHKRLSDFLSRPDVPRGMGFSSFIEWALNRATTALDACEDDGSGYCYVHHGWDGGAESEDRAMACDMAGMG